ncbi:DUF4175 domain-containing protein [Paramagnetospirillum kuznetsovii]|uniref:DUF4175 domain-containing protein n=1 Tax=Paramagnetospirillum kuznetsovii TaxID=2053833 RepID=A0A364P0I3_9PROT|nr:DUF4175 family protein [Paramagnetospirillum kuznetsovii]RAU22813.1 DUF4175 domain-containing protein [Paramagnetospirillum kuznetsovii]
MSPLPLADRLRLARLALWGELLAPGVTALWSLLALAAALALLDVAADLPGWLHAAGLAGWLAAIGLVTYRLTRIARPSDAQAARRLEEDSGVGHRPLAALDDCLAGGDAALWQAHLRRMEKQAEGLTPGWPRPVMARHDPLGLRFAALLLLVIAGAGGLADWHDRARRFLLPALDLPGLGPSALEVWITPPAYTGLTAMALRPGMGAIAVPEASGVRAVVAGGWGGASLKAGDAVIAFTNDDGGGQRAEGRITGGAVLAVDQGWRTVAAWPMTVIRDALPSIALVGQPEPDERGRLQLSLDASDDYGIARIWLEIQPMETAAPPLVLPSPLVVPMPLPGDKPRSLSFASRIDLAAHDWAGQTVRLIPKAEDGAGQIGSGEATVVSLPERIFRHPVARALIQWRKEVSEAPRLGPDVAEKLRRLLSDPDAIGGDARVFLTLALTQRLLAAESFDRDDVRDLLWNAAARLDDGGLPAAEKDLEQARRELEQALAANAPPSRLAELVERFEAAMDRYLSALAESGMETESSPDSETIGEDELNEMLDSLRAMAETGNREALRRRLAELSETLSRLGEARPPGKADQRAAEIKAKLRDIARRQQDLLDHSFRKSPSPTSEDEGEDSPAPAKPSAAEARKAAEAQKALRDALAKLNQSLGDHPTTLDDAARSMGEAAKSLDKGDWPVAAEQQSDALRLLGDGARDMADAMESRRAKGKGGVIARDPFGRAQQGSAHRDDGTTKVPGQVETQRAREILDELRRRAGDPRRPDLEIEYLRRLLKQF